MSTTTFNLSTLTLAVGDHSVTVKAKASGYKESAASSAVTYTVAPPQLAAPVISLSGSVVSWTSIATGVTYKISCFSGSILKTVTTTATSYDLSTISDLTAGTWTVTVIATATGYTDSDASNAVTYTVAPAVTFTRVYLTKVGAEYSANTLSKLENMNTSKVYSIRGSGTGIFHFTYTNGAWVVDNSDVNITGQTSDSVTFHLYTAYYHVYTNYIALEGTQGASANDMDKYTLGSDPALAEWQCFVENTHIWTDSGIKKVQHVTYDDNILVWNFDEGKLDYAKPIFIKQEQTSDSYWHVTDEDGKTVNLVGSNGKSHRLYNKRTHLFEYPQDIPECKCEEIHESVKYYNILTEYHFNCYANGILTSKRYSNMLYPITDEMKYDKTVKHTNTCKREQFDFLTDEEFEKLRLSEMEYSDEMRDEVRRFFALKKAK